MKAPIDHLTKSGSYYRLHTGIVNTVTTTMRNGSVSGQSVPDYEIKIQRKQDASSPYSFQYGAGGASIRFNFSESFLSGANNNVPYSSSGYTYSRGTRFSWCSAIPSYPAYDDIALKRLRSRLANDAKEFKALVPLAEIKETRALLGQVTQASIGLVRGLLELKHGHIRDAAKRAGDAWLTFSFGVSPTIADINSLGESIQSYLNGPLETKEYHGKFRRDFNTEVNSQAADGWTNLGYYGRFRMPHTRNESYSVQYTAGVNFSLRNAVNYGIGSQFGLSFGEIIPTAWELVPFSWIVDYFSTTGDFLADMFETPSGSSYFCTKSVKYKRVTSFRPEISNYYALNGLTPPKNYVFNISDTGAKIEETFFQRSVYSQIPHRAFRFKTIDEIGANSVKRLLNLASLLV